jgi:hypothetical protein
MVFFPESILVQHYNSIDSRLYRNESAEKIVVAVCFEKGMHASFLYISNTAMPGNFLELSGIETPSSESGKMRIKK